MTDPKRLANGLRGLAELKFIGPVSKAMLLEAADALVVDAAGGREPPEPSDYAILQIAAMLKLTHLEARDVVTRVLEAQFTGRAGSEQAAVTEDSGHSVNAVESRTAPTSPASSLAAAPEESSTMKGQVMLSESERSRSQPEPQRASDSVMPEGRDSVTNARAAAAPECPARRLAREAVGHLRAGCYNHARSRALADELRATLAAPCVPAGPEPSDEPWTATFSGGCCDGLELHWPRLRASVDLDGPPKGDGVATRNHYVLMEANGWTFQALYVVRELDELDDVPIGSPPERGTAAP